MSVVTKPQKQDIAQDDSVDGKPTQVGDLDQIRQILIGSYLQEIDIRFQGLGTKLSESVEELRSTLIERTDAVSAKFEEEIRKLHNELGEERGRTNQAREALAQRVTSTKNDLQQQLGALGQTLAAAETALRDDSNRGLGELKEQIRGQLANISERMDREFSRLDGATVTRKSFSDALRELSTQFDEHQRQQ